MEMIRWLDPTPVSTDSLASLGLPPLVAELLVHRGIVDASSAQAFLHPEQQSSPRFPGLETAVDRLQTAIRGGEQICVWGDFDADGQTATAVLVQALRDLGARVSYHVPTRAREGHGVQLESLRAILDRGARVVLTCDTGITAHEAVAFANSRGVDVLITDHHDLGDDLPPAFSVVNPKLLPAGHPLSHLTGVGVAYKLAEALADAANRGPIGGLDLVAVGLVADVGILAGESRRLAREGILALRQTSRTGLRAIADTAEVSLASATEETIGFALAPRLNAVGRLGDAALAVELLLSSDPVRSRVIAAQLESYNTQRRLLTEQVLDAAEEWIQANPGAVDKPILVLQSPTWPGGVLGIVAGRLSERYRKPVIILSEPDEGILRGSARSIEGVHITQAIASEKPHLITFGGHPMAAGLSLHKDALPAFRLGIERTVGAMLQAAQIEQATLQIDSWLDLDQVSTELASQVEQLAPFGAGNQPPVFATRAVSLESMRTIGREGEHQRLTIRDVRGVPREVLWWDARADRLPQGRFDLAFSVRATSYAGAPQVVIELRDFRALEETGAYPTPSAIEIVDLRQAPDLGRLPESCLIWAEGVDAALGVDRFHLRATNDFAILTPPPSPRELQAALAVARPSRLFLLASMPRDVKTTQSFLTRLGGLAKYALNHQGGRTRISGLAAACAQRELAIRLGLEWLAAGGHLQCRTSGDEVELESAEARPNPELQKELLSGVRSLVNEAAAYRRHFGTADARTLL
jgi:single-stranded-DNA-specific exonuclease